MCILRYLNNNESFETETDLMGKIKYIQESGNYNNQFVVVEKQGYGFMEIVLGMGKDSLLFYTPELEEDDCKISCNSMIARAKDEDIYITSLEGEKLAFSKSNMVTLKDAYKVIVAYLKGDDFMEIIDWYTY